MPAASAAACEMKCPRPDGDAYSFTIRTRAPTMVMPVSGGLLPPCCR